jgi:uncharacterized protein YqeY
MGITDQLKRDITTAMKAGDKVRVGALRVVLSELQKSAKDGKEDEMAVLRREQKRRLESAQAFEQAGRKELAASERAESELIACYLPAQLNDEELAQIVAQAIVQTDATTMRDMGKVMAQATKEVGDRASGSRVAGMVKERLQGGG